MLSSLVIDAVAVILMCMVISRAAAIFEEHNTQVLETVHVELNSFS